MTQLGKVGKFISPNTIQLASLSFQSDDAGRRSGLRSGSGPGGQVVTEAVADRAQHCRWLWH